MPDPVLNERELAFLRTLHRGQSITGMLTEITSFGDIGGFIAMINIPELSWRPINHPSDVVAVGQEVTAEILDVDVDVDVDIERGRVPLSLKALQEDPLLDLQPDEVMSRLRRENADLRKLVKIYAETIRQLTIDKEALAVELAKASGVTRLHLQ